MQSEGRMQIIPYVVDEGAVEMLSQFPTQGAALRRLSLADKVQRIISDLDGILIQSPWPKRPSVRELKFDRVDLAIITILPQEYGAILRHLDLRSPAPRTSDVPVPYA